MNSQLKHYLVSMPMSGNSFLHGYVITDDHDNVMKVANHMADQLNGRQSLPICLESLLNLEGAKRVQSFLSANFPKSGKLLKKVNGFHFTCWSVPNEAPDAEWLMALH